MTNSPDFAFWQSVPELTLPSARAQLFGQAAVIATESADFSGSVAVTVQSMVAGGDQIVQVAIRPPESAAHFLRLVDQLETGLAA